MPGRGNWAERRRKVGSSECWWEWGKEAPAESGLRGEGLGRGVETTRRAKAGAPVGESLDPSPTDPLNELSPELEPLIDPGKAGRRGPSRMRLPKLSGGVKLLCSAEWVGSKKAGWRCWEEDGMGEDTLAMVMGSEVVDSSEGEVECPGRGSARGGAVSTSSLRARYPSDLKLPVPPCGHPVRTRTQPQMTRVPAFPAPPDLSFTNLAAAADPSSSLTVLPSLVQCFLLPRPESECLSPLQRPRGSEKCLVLGEEIGGRGLA